MSSEDRPPNRSPATVQHLEAIPESERFHEVLDGELVRKAMPSADHAHAQRKLSSLLDPYDARGNGPGKPSGPGGWWLLTEVEVAIPSSNSIPRPDIAGWRTDKVPKLPKTFPLAVCPDWVCEVVSPSTESNDKVWKRQIYAAAGLPYYWLIEPHNEMLTVLRLDGHTYLVEQVVRPGDCIGLAPFERVQIPIEVLFLPD